MDQHLGPYRLLRTLGSGGMGVVHEALHPELGRRVAIKQLRRDAIDLRAVERFRREGRILARLRHPGVVLVHELAEGDDGPYLVQELVEGETLAQVLARGGPLDPPNAARIVAELARSLAVVHAEGILHRDLKPANVILRPDGRPVLIDFGVAGDHRAERLTRTGELVGTLNYFSPEQAAGTEGLDERSDVYGLGAVLYELLAGQPPFQGTAVKVVADILTQGPALAGRAAPGHPPPPGRDLPGRHGQGSRAAGPHGSSARRRAGEVPGRAAPRAGSLAPAGGLGPRGLSGRDRGDRAGDGRRADQAGGPRAAPGTDQLRAGGGDLSRRRDPVDRPRAAARL